MNKRPSQIYCISGNGVVSADARRQKTVGVNETNNDNGCLILAIICKDINVRTKRKQGDGRGKRSKRTDEEQEI